MQWTAGPWESMISSWGSWVVPGGWIPLDHPWCPPGTSLLSWLDFRGVPLSHWTQSSWNSCRLRQRSWLHSLPSKGSGTLKAFSVSKECLVFGPAYWIRAQGSHQGGGGGRSSLSVAVSRKSIAHIRGPPRSFRSSEQPMRWRVGARRLSGGHLQSCGLGDMNTFTRFYSLRVEPVSSVLSNR